MGPDHRALRTFGFFARDGTTLFEHKIPFTAAAVPATYRLAKNGKQYVVIACGGHRRMRTELHEAMRQNVGDVLVALALP